MDECHQECHHPRLSRSDLFLDAVLRAEASGSRGITLAVMIAKR